jgi:outer membrane protein assembly factor BamD (BamD/ComL family)
MGDQESDELRRSRVKPGNLVYIRVVDEDRSRTDKVDQLVVSVEASSGDQVGRVLLRETDTHSGVFEGQLRTGNAQAMAFATTTRPGLNPNMVISPRSYGPWKGAPGAQKGSSLFSVDLNDNVALEKLTITASEPGYALKRFRVLAGFNRDNLSPVATWPRKPMVENSLVPSVLIAEQPEDRQKYWHRGNPRGDTGNNPKYAYSLNQLKAFFEKEFLRAGTSFQYQLKGPSEAFSPEAYAQAEWVKKAKPNQLDVRNVACRFQAHFYEKEKVVRSFAVALGNRPQEVTIPRKEGTMTSKGGNELPVFVTLNGQALEWNGKTFQGELTLQPGLQKLEIFYQGNASGIGFGRKCKVFSRLPNETSWSEMPESVFDPASFPVEIKNTAILPAEISGNPEGTAWEVSFGNGARARILAIEMLEHEGSEPSLSKLNLTSVGGKQVLPVTEDYQEVSKNDVLEILSGDQIWVRYIDDRYVNKSKERQERVLSAGFSDAELVFNGLSDNPYRQAIQFAHGQIMYMTVNDPDMDVTDGKDSLTVTLTTQSGSKANVVLTERRSGSFVGALTLTKDPATQPGTLQTADGDVVTMHYWDKENVRPGVPVERKISVSHAVYQQPKMVVSHMELGDEAVIAVTPDESTVEGERTGADYYQKIPINLTPALIKPDNQQVYSFFSGLDAVVDIIAPHLLIQTGTELKIFVQTENGRKRAEEARQAAAASDPQGAAPASAPVYDVTVPGTRMFTAIPDTSRRWVLENKMQKADLVNVYSINQPNRMDTYWDDIQKKIKDDHPLGIFRATFQLGPGYTDEPPLPVSEALLLRYATAGTSHPLTAEEMDQFRKSVGYAALAWKHWAKYVNQEGRSRLLEPLVVEPGENIYIGFRYEDDQGRAQWQTATARAVTHGVFMATAERDGLPVEGIVSLGDRVRVDVADLGLDISDDLDTVEVQVTAESGASYPLELRESGVHSGRFAGSFELVIDMNQSMSNRNIAVLGFPATYEDTVRVSFTDSSGRQLPPVAFSLTKGADGFIEPFSKQYGDDDIAIQTQFAMAEAYLEAAKSYKENKQMNEAVLSYETAQQLLTSTLDRFSDKNAHSRAEYLLGDLAYEKARSATDPALQKESFYAALSRFSKVTANYPETVDAAKAQFKKAVTYERLGEPDSAAQEYVKLAYMYPDSEFLAVAMYRLGTHFRAKAKRDHQQLAARQQEMAAKGGPKAMDRDQLFEIDQLAEEVKGHYMKAGKIFGRLQERFPTHELAGKGGLRSAQCFYAAGDYGAALAPLVALAEGEDYATEERSEAMYWAAKCYVNMGDSLSAFSMFVRCTEDFPETEWSGYCLSELAQPGMQEVETKIKRQARIAKDELKKRALGL